MLLVCRTVCSKLPQKSSGNRIQQTAAFLVLIFNINSLIIFGTFQMSVAPHMFAMLPLLVMLMEKWQAETPNVSKPVFA